MKKRSNNSSFLILICRLVIVAFKLVDCHLLYKNRKSVTQLLANTFQNCTYCTQSHRDGILCNMMHFSLDYCEIVFIVNTVLIVLVLLKQCLRLCIAITILNAIVSFLCFTIVETLVAETEFLTHYSLLFMALHLLFFLVAKSKEHEKSIERRARATQTDWLLVSYRQTAITQSSSSLN